MRHLNHILQKIGFQLNKNYSCGVIAKIKLIDINFTKKIIKVTGKGSKERYVILGNQAFKALNNYIFIRINFNSICFWNDKQL